MSAIKVTKYQTIVTKITQAQQQLTGISTKYYDCAYAILTSNYFDPELDLLQPFWTAYNSAEAIYQQTPGPVISAVAALQAHIVDKAKSTDGTQDYDDVNDWLKGEIDGVFAGRYQDSIDGPIKVTEEFADLSAAAGFPIDDENIV